jgi:hypothetical protein
MADVRCTQGGTTTLTFDIEESMLFTKNPMHHFSNNAHGCAIQVSLRELEVKVIELKYCLTKHMVADMLTKMPRILCNLL